MKANIVLQCPQCKKPVHWNDRFPHRPFCSDRCKQIDFGSWASEEHRIAGQALYSVEESGVEDPDFENTSFEGASFGDASFEDPGLQHNSKKK